MTTKISNVTTVIDIESTHLGFIFKGQAEIYNNQKVIKKINCQVTKEGEAPSDSGLLAPRIDYIVTRGAYAETYVGVGGGLACNDEILTAGIEFESMLNTKIQDGLFNESETI